MLIPVWRSCIIDPYCFEFLWSFFYASQPSFSVVRTNGGYFSSDLVGSADSGYLDRQSALACVLPLLYEIRQCTSMTGLHRFQFNLHR